ncbi:MAG: hypothetical protein FRX49_12556 [Trebouxia sp. A1-2]|nr:MAG: hypothetical protein FRX49_12556 [Trebouxia sp. A1-2]
MEAARVKSWAPRIVGLDPGRKALFTAVVHSQPAADSLHRGRPCESKYDTLSWSCSRWQEASGIKHRLRKSELWLNRKPALKAALLDTPTAKREVAKITDPRATVYDCVETQNVVVYCGTGT